MRWSIAAVMICSLAVSCGDDGSGDQGRYVDAIAASLASGDPTALNLPSEPARCVAENWVETIGVDRLRAKGIEPDELGNQPDHVALATVGFSPADGDEMYDAFAACEVDLEHAIVAASGLGDEGSRCLTDSISDDLMQELFVATVTNPDAGRAPPSAVDREFERILERCSREDQGR